MLIVRLPNDYGKIITMIVRWL